MNKDKITKLLNSSKKNHSVVGLKTSFEDEGITIEDLMELRLITDRCNLPLYVKIGGCEAKSDILNCNNLMIDGLVCPMIESDFALEKFVRSARDIEYSGKLFVNLETKTSFENLQKIINSPSSKNIEGFTVGRSDFVASYGLSKESVNSEQVYIKVKKMMEEVSDLGFTTTMGGNVTSESKIFITNLFKLGLLRKIETRNIILELNEDSIDNIDDMINNALYLETLILEQRRKRTKFHFMKNSLRLDNITKRIK